MFAIIGEDPKFDRVLNRDAPPPLALNGRVISEEAQVVKFWMDENAPLPSEP
ncbi:hypothetical protein [Aureliella helgolandensis]|uniref:hypothetical protein n=1 Tax=Aureliella helgolandensis TaxID=2527968 RepID=UPI0018D05CC4|nr:hypothetical protein [Aureliella helgolandensis]